VKSPLRIRLPIFRDLRTKVTPFALMQIYNQWNLFNNQATTELKPCTRTFTKTMGLPCAHIIAERSANGGTLRIKDIHPHWRFKKPEHIPGDEVTEDEPYAEGAGIASDDEVDTEVDVTPIDDELIRVADPAIIKLKGRPVGALNKRKRDENSTRRDPSGFEYANTPARGGATRRSRVNKPAFTANEVENQETQDQVNAYFGSGAGGTVPQRGSRSNTTRGRGAGNSTRGRAARSVAAQRARGATAPATTGGATARPPRRRAGIPERYRDDITDIINVVGLL